MADAVPAWLRHARDHWTNRGDRRPEFAIEPGPGQESVWDYPRPPAVVADGREVAVDGSAGPIARADRSVKVCETSHPPAFYVPPESIVDASLVIVPGSSHCEWKGQAEYVAVVGTTEPVGWRYPKPYAEFADYANWVSFYPALVECRVAGELARPQAGGFYGGWITDDVVGPFKGEPGTSAW
ncbi:MAG: DUF427 domain-containing protein [Actinomycetota bacterium]